MISSMIPVPGVVHDFVLHIMARNRNSTCRLKSESFSSGLDFCLKDFYKCFQRAVNVAYSLYHGFVWCIAWSKFDYTVTQKCEPNSNSVHFSI